MAKTSLELKDTSVGQLSRTPEQQETSFMKISCKVCSTSLPEPRRQSCCGEHMCQSCVPENQPCPLCNCNEQGAADSTCRDILDSWEIVECSAEVSEPREPRKWRGSSPEVERIVRSGKRKKVEYPSFSIRKVLIKQTIRSPRFYTSNGYMLEIEFRYKKGHQNNVRVYIYARPGKNDKDLRWPLTGKVQILSIDLGGDTRNTSEISGRWERPSTGTYCKGELDIPYENLPQDSMGMLKFCVQVIPD